MSTGNYTNRDYNSFSDSEKIEALIDYANDTCIEFADAMRSEMPDTVLLPFLTWADALPEQDDLGIILIKRWRDLVRTMWQEYKDGKLPVQVLRSNTDE